MNTLIRDVFRGRTAVIATMHGKEAAIAPVLERELGLHCIVPVPYDTDLLGTFTGEVERLHDPLTTARLKCLGAMDLTGCDIGIASEGSFGPLPGAFFVSCGEEWLILSDRKHDFEVVVKELCPDTNFAGQEVHTWEELIHFAHAALFPEHALILRRNSNSGEQIHKGIRSLEELFRLYSRLAGQEGRCYVETDMRAMHNPTRMKAIGRVAEKLAERAAHPCPACGRPGYGITSAEPGLPCAWCRHPTQLTLKHTCMCTGCGHRSEMPRPDGRTTADPGCCDYCNP